MGEMFVPEYAGRIASPPGIPHWAFEFSGSREQSSFEVVV
jgi:hypothetical protein